MQVGTGFINGQVVTIVNSTGGTTTAASGIATANSLGVLSAVTIINSGSGILNKAAVTISSSTSTTNATGTVVVQNGIVVPNSPPSQNPISGGQASNNFANALVPGKVVIRYKPTDYTGSYVYHCHILTHEDRGMMALVTILPNIPIYATGAGPGGTPQVNVYNSITNSLITSFLAFEPGFSGGVTTAVADVNNDGVSDLIVGAGPGGGPRVQVFDGATNFTTVLKDFFAFNTAFRGGVSVTGGDFNSDGYADIAVGAGPGGGPMVSIFDGQTGATLNSFWAFDSAFSGGVTVATGDTDGSGFPSLITGAGVGGGPEVRVWRNSQFFAIGSTPILPGAQTISPMNLTSAFYAYELAYTGGVQVSTGLTSGMSQGGFDRIITGTLSGAPLVSVWQAMGNMDPYPMSATPANTFEQVFTFFAFDSTITSGVLVGSVDVSTGSDLLVSTGAAGTVVTRYSLLPGVDLPTTLFQFNPFPGFKGGTTLGGSN